MGVIEGGQVIAEALKGVVVATRSALMVAVATVDGMMIGTIIMKAGAEGIEVQALGVGEDGAEALGIRGIVVQSVKAVRRGVLKLHNGIVKGNNRKMETILIEMLPLITTKMVMMDTCRMMISTISSSRSSLHFWEPISLIKSLSGLCLSFFYHYFHHLLPQLKNNYFY